MSGEVEIIGGWDGEHSYVVMHWDRHRDSGWAAAAFKSRGAALTFALAYAREHDCEMPSAEIINLAETRR
ncbi:hypothetical protein EF888_07300 [Silicimonas algicola]|uniref:AP2 domain-containing protein n=1 Tax=Silicimonas algicola TaxID=1826607 RepID=A0A316G3L4_9RHOB|nr:hypothetical protein [Silicimonas algicola]AZQ66958.1 hypothetical protein EF888_07300 [Silicimonas algicola]PWK55534.1 hypothetical protein C8D95_107200 [Silicimonas algicola]